MAEGLDLGVSGLASGFDWRSLVDQLSDVERAPQQRMLLEQQKIQARKVAYGSITTQLAVLQNRVAALRESRVFGARALTVSNPELALATAKADTIPGTYAFQVDQLASAAIFRGTQNIAAALSPSGDVNALILGEASFAGKLTAGMFTVNGKQVTFAATDSLGALFQKISDATGGDVTASYDASGDRISLSTSSGSPIVLGSSADTSNFLTVARLSNNGTSTVSSSGSVGSIKTDAKLAAANFSTSVTDGGSGAGVFKINGVEISFDADQDSLNDVLSRINESQAGVFASYDTVNDRLALTNKVTGDLGIALEDVTGNFLNASGLVNGTLSRGKDLLYSVNGGGQLVSHSNTITESSSGLAGLSVTALDVGSFSVSVSLDAEKIRKAVTDLLEDYNKAQGIIDTNTASSTDVTGKVDAGPLAGESEAYTIASELRRIVTSTISGFSFGRLESIGIESNGDNNNLRVADGDKLDGAIASNLADLEKLFLDPDQGIGARLDAYLEKVVGEGGSLEKKETTLDRQIAEVRQQITDQEKQVQANREQLISQFVAMEEAQLRINQQMQYLLQRFG